MSFGPNIPQFKNIAIHDVQLDGVLVCSFLLLLSSHLLLIFCVQNMDCDMLYPGGFSVLLKLVVNFDKVIFLFVFVP